MIEYIYISLVSLFVIGLLVIGFVMDKDDLEEE